MKHWVALLVLAAIAVLAVVAGQAASSPSAQETAVLKLAEAGRTAVLRNRPVAVCRLLTRRARRNALLDGNYVDHRFDQRRTKRATCENAVGFLIREMRDDRIYREAQRRPSKVGFQILRIRGRRAHLLMTVRDSMGDPTESDIYLLKGSEGWRADFANFSPFDGSSGR